MADSPLLASIDRFRSRSEPGRRPGFDLTEDERLAVSRNQIYLPVAAPPITGDDPKPVSFVPSSRRFLAGDPDLPAGAGVAATHGGVHRGGKTRNGQMSASGTSSTLTSL